MVTVLGGETIEPGEVGLIRIVPLVPEFWQGVDVGSHLQMCEGPHRIGEATVTKVWRQH
jgi:hypothetical protein